MTVVYKMQDMTTLNMHDNHPILHIIFFELRKQGQFDAEEDNNLMQRKTDMTDVYRSFFIELLFVRKDKN